MIIAHTEAAAVHGFEEAMARARAYAEAGADVTFVEAPTSREEIQRIARELACPQIINVVVGGKTPALNVKDFADMGFAMVLYANAALQGAVLGMVNALSHLNAHGELPERPDLLASFADRQTLVRKPLFDALDIKYGAGV